MLAGRSGREESEGVLRWTGLTGLRNMTVSYNVWGHSQHSIEQYTYYQLVQSSSVFFSIEVVFLEYFCSHPGAQQTPPKQIMTDPSPDWEQQVRQLAL